MSAPPRLEMDRPAWTADFAASLEGDAKRELRKFIKRGKLPVIRAL